MPGYSENTLQPIISFFQSAISSDKENVRQSYRNAVAAFERFAAPADTTIIDEHFVTTWITNLLVQGYTPKVAVHYLKIISSLYNKGVKAGLWESTDAFKATKARMERIEKITYDATEETEIFQRVRSVICNSEKTGYKSVYADIFVATVFAGAASPYEMGAMRKDRICDYIPEIQELCKRHISPTRKYVFDINQSRLTPRQLAQTLTERITDFLERNYIKRGKSLPDTIANIWAVAALKCGIEPQKITGCLNTRPAINPVFAICDMAEVSSDEKASILSTVAQTLISNPPHWFAMRLRPLVKYSQLVDRLESTDSKVERPVLFYPCEEIKKRINRKMVLERKPVIPDIVFFKSRMTDVLPLFREIGDIAWCYTSSTNDGCKYAIVRKSAMERFQQAIGKFSSDYEVGPIGSITPQVGDRIVIIGGLFSGNEAMVDKIENDNSRGNTIYQVKFPDEQGIEWRVGVDSRLVKSVDA